MKIFQSFVLLACIIGLVSADLYMHVPRGSNNRAREKSATRANNNRLFDSQNNARGGYNYGDKNQASNSENDHYRMNYFQSGKSGKTDLTIEWTNQHGCGGNEDSSPHKLNCNLVLQYMCQPDTSTAAPDDSITFRNGQQTNTQDYTKPSKNNDETKSAVEGQRNKNVNAGRGLHESWEWYDSCYRRERNKGLFTADQNLQNNNQGVSSAVFTRQNPNDNRRGYECPEERDYFPYWHPTDWRDIAVLAHNESWCSYYRTNSFNSRTYGECVESFNDGARKHWSAANNATKCSDLGGEWVEYESFLELASTYTTQQQCLANNNNANQRSGIVYKWGKPYDRKKIVNHEVINDACFVAMPPIFCKSADWSRVNHLGNGRDGVTLNYTWSLPHFPSQEKKRCVFRMRYNISTDDYAPFGTDSDDNEKKTNNVVTKRSPIEQNPLVNIGADGQLLQLAINTDQTGRTFQDRSHVFFLSKRPDEVADTAHIINLNIRGKRGNIVQVYPAVEYDFSPNNLHITTQDLIHLQWTGSNTHNNEAPGGDGQTGNAGEGKEGSDKNNFVEMRSASENFPVPYELNRLHRNMQILWNDAGMDTSVNATRNYAIQLASAGYYKCESKTVCQGDSIERKSQLDSLLNNAPSSFAGMIFKLNKGTYHYMCTRNNNFSNRSQKGKIVVK